MGCTTYDFRESLSWPITSEEPSARWGLTFPAAAVEDPLDPDAGQLALGFGGEGDDEAQEGARKRRPWAWLLRYVWQVDVSACSLCGGPMKWVEVATKAEDVRRVLAGLGQEDPHGVRQAPTKMQTCPELTPLHRK